MDFLIGFFSTFLANIAPSLIPGLKDRSPAQKITRRPPKKLFEELRLFLKVIFPQNPPELRKENCWLLPDSKTFFLEKSDILDSLERDINGSVNIICRVPWLIMPDNYRDVYLDTPESRLYYSMLERQARRGKLRYLYNLNSLNTYNFTDAIKNGRELHSYPMMLTSTSFDVMIVQTDRHRHKIIFALRPIGHSDQEIGILVTQKDLYFIFKEYFDKLWNNTEAYWAKQLNGNNDSIDGFLKSILTP